MRVFRDLRPSDANKIELTFCDEQTTPSEKLNE